MALFPYVFIAFVSGQALASTIRQTTVVQTTNCTYNGKTYGLGSFRPSPCEHCQCTSTGRAFCAIADCAPPQCADYVRHPDQCCPVCPNGPNCSYKGHIIKQGESYHPDANTVCSCPTNPFHGFGLGGSSTAICATRSIDPVPVRPIHTVGKTVVYCCVLI